MAELKKSEVNNVCNGSKVIPGPRGWPIIGNLKQLDTKHLQMTFLNWKLEFGSIFQFSMLGLKCVVLNDVKAFEDVFGNDHMQNRPENGFYRTFNFNGRGITLSNFTEENRIVKEMVGKIFHDINDDKPLRKLESSEMDSLIQRLCSADNVDLEALITASIAKQFTIDMLGHEPEESLIATVLEYMHAALGIFAEGREFLLTVHPWIRYIPGSTRNAVLRVTKAQKDLITNIMSAAKPTYKEGEEHGMIHRFLSEQKRRNEKAGRIVVDDEQLYACIVDLIAGFVGPYKNLVICFFCLLHNPDIYGKVKVEISKVYQEKNPEDVRLEDSAYLQAFVMECMRFSTLVPVTFSHTVERDMEIAGYRFEKGMTVMGSVWNAHHDEKTWGDPWVLRPERFLDETGKVLPQSHPTRRAFIPFGTGARKCKGDVLGLSKIYRNILRILFHCELLPPKDSSILPDNDPKKYFSSVGLNPPKFRCSFIRKE